MTKNRLEAFSDGVLAIILTIMVLELKVPHGDDVAALRPLIPVFLSYILSFAYVAIYWLNHHHMLQTVRHVNGAILWANLHLLFWLSLVPFVTGWVGENHFAATPIRFYCVVLLGAAIAYTILQFKIIRLHGQDSELAQAIGSDSKGHISIFCYFLAFTTSFWQPLGAFAILIFVALIWFLPDRRIEKRLQNSPLAEKE